MIFGAPLGPVGRVWPGQFAAALGAYAATVDDHIPGCGRRFRSRANHPNECGVHAVQQGLRAPLHEASPQRRAADPILGGPQLPPLHAFTQKEPQRFDHRLGGAARTTLIAVPPFNPVDQTGHKAACRWSHRPSPVSIARESWVLSPFPTAALTAKRSSSAAQPTSENRALYRSVRMGRAKLPAVWDRATYNNHIARAGCKES